MTAAPRQHELLEIAWPSARVPRAIQVRGLITSMILAIPREYGKHGGLSVVSLASIGAFWATGFLPSPEVPSPESGMAH
jgi:hypothetical protein